MSDPPARPKTKEQYKAALLNLDVVLPTGRPKLADYKALWQQHKPPQQQARALSGQLSAEPTRMAVHGCLEIASRL